MKQKGRKNYFMMVIAAILVVFAMWNLLWFAYIQFFYKPFTENIPMNNGVYLRTENSWDYSVAMPRYLRFNGNLCLFDEMDNNLVIWPSLLGKTKYVIGINLSNEEMVLKEVNAEVDEYGQLLDGFRSEENIALWEAHQEEITALFSHAKEEWDFS